MGKKIIYKQEKKKKFLKHSRSISSYKKKKKEIISTIAFIIKIFIDLYKKIQK